MNKILICAAAALLVGCAPRLKPSFDPAVAPRADDLGPHGDLMEWWYLSGYLPGEKLAFHWAQFKVSTPRFPADLYFAHVAVTDLTTGRLTFLEQPLDLGRGKASYPPLRLQQGDWAFDQVMNGAGQTARFNLAAGPLVLSAVPQKPPVIHPPGYSGVPNVTGAMYYQSVTRLHLTGTVAGRPVQGQAWLDHQWGGMAPGRGARWDWMSVQLSGGEDLMLYRVLSAEGQVVQTFGSVVDQQGIAHAATNVVMTPGRIWSAPSGHEYVLDWKVRADEFDLDVKAVHDNQELVSRSTGVTYWEGPIEVSGTWRGAPQTGGGMMELVAGSKKPS
ncbi:lipocalin-like domain-containing protein [Deinococcus sp.]|uniref:lipocalin-like domain-containing protein n=1 Tax=Deinococcus sp. TaxID=47478 RepID=UPI0025C009C2|nr:lipocalin-like domain-containing protein [Deinococcus sp.]